MLEATVLLCHICMKNQSWPKPAHPMAWRESVDLWQCSSNCSQQYLQIFHVFWEPRLMQWMLSLVLFCLEQILLSFSLPLPKREQKVSYTAWWQVLNSLLLSVIVILGGCGVYFRASPTIEADVCCENLRHSPGERMKRQSWVVHPSLISLTETLCGLKDLLCNYSKIKCLE